MEWIFLLRSFEICLSGTILENLSKREKRNLIHVFFFFIRRINSLRFIEKMITRVNHIFEIFPWIVHCIYKTVKSWLFFVVVVVCGTIKSVFFYVKLTDIRVFLCVKSTDMKRDELNRAVFDCANASAVSHCLRTNWLNAFRKTIIDSINRYIILL